MRAVIQRVREARVEVEGEAVSAIGPGLLKAYAITFDQRLRLVRFSRD